MQIIVDFRMSKRLVGIILQMIKRKMNPESNFSEDIMSLLSGHSNDPSVSTSTLIDTSLHDDGVISSILLTEMQSGQATSNILKSVDVNTPMKESSSLHNQEDESNSVFSPMTAATATTTHSESKVKLTKQTDSFVRQSTKYWVKQCDLAAVCTALGQHLSVYVFGDGLAWTPISSVYLDNAKRECYNERIVKNTGARILRLRTYDNSSGIWVERKVHHEAWTGETSSKDRFPIKETQVMQLLRGQHLHVSSKHEVLAKEIREMITTLGLYPTLRVNYDRIAFQPTDHDHVRVSIDINMRYLNERTSHMDWRTPDSELSMDDEIHFPYAIVEIKLREPFISNPPEWLSELEQSSLLHKENNFSKYIHGTYAFHEICGAGSSTRLRRPLWYSNMEFITPQMAVASTTLKEKSMKKVLDSQLHWFSRLLGFKEHLGDDGKPIRIEPKVFFANERTFLTWFQSALFVSSIGIAIISSDPASRTTGGILLTIGALLIFYAIFTYTQRGSSLLRRVGNGYHDPIGPPVLGVTVVSVFFVAFLFADNII